MLTLTGSSTWTAGTLSGPGGLTNSGILSLATGANNARISGSTLTNSGIINQSSGDLQFINSGGSVFNNLAGAVYNFQNDVGISSSGNGQGTATNAGTISKTAGTGTSTIGVSFSNTGAVQATSGTLSFPTVPQLSGSTLTGGAWNVHAHSTLRLPSAITTNAATILLDGSGSNFYAGMSGSTNALAGLVSNAAAGSFTLENGRTFSPSDAFTNAGSLNVGAGSMLTVQPPLTNQWSAEGNANDSVGTSNGVLENGASFAPGVTGQAFSFNGVNNDVKVPANSTFNIGSGFTVDFWVNASSTQPGATNGLFALVDKSHGFIDNTGWVFQGAIFRRDSHLFRRHGQHLRRRKHRREHPGLQVASVDGRLHRVGAADVRRWNPEKYDFVHVHPRE